MAVITNYPDLKFPPEAQGPAMAALWDDRQRKFAYIMGCGALTIEEAAREAGYSEKQMGHKVRASLLLQRPAMIAAIREVALKVLGGLAPIAIHAARQILEDPKHPARTKMIEIVLDRTGFEARSEHKVVVEHSVDKKGLDDLVAQLAVARGIDPVKLLGSNTVIEGEVVDARSEGKGDPVF